MLIVIVINKSYITIHIESMRKRIIESEWIVDNNSLVSSNKQTKVNNNDNTANNTNNINIQEEGVSITQINPPQSQIFPISSFRSDTNDFSLSVSRH